MLDIFTNSDILLMDFLFKNNGVSRVNTKMSQYYMSSFSLEIKLLTGNYKKNQLKQFRGECVFSWIQ